MKKKFMVNVHYDVMFPVEVYAETEEEALDLAYNESCEMSLNEGDAEYADSSVTDVTLTDEPLTPQKETLIDRIRAILLINGSNEIALNITNDDVKFIQLWRYEGESKNIFVLFSFDNKIYSSVIEEIPMEVLAEMLKVVQIQVHNSK